MVELSCQCRVDFFYLGNNLSVDAYLPIVAPFVDRNLAFLEQVATDDIGDFEDKVHIPFYERARKWGEAQNVKWLGLMDSDEFLVPMEGTKILPLLDLYEHYAALSLNWACFGTSGYKQLAAEDNILEKLVWRTELNDIANRFSKKLIRPDRIKRVEFIPTNQKNHRMW